MQKCSLLYALQPICIMYSNEHFRPYSALLVNGTYWCIPVETDLTKVKYVKGIKFVWKGSRDTELSGNHCYRLNRSSAV